MSKNFYNKKGGSLKSFLQGHNKITVNIQKFNKQKAQVEKNKKKLDKRVQERGIGNMIEKMRIDMENLPYSTFKNLCEVLQVYDEFMYWYTPGEDDLPVTAEQVKENTKSINKVHFLKKSTKKFIIKEMKNLHKDMSEYDPEDENLEMDWDLVAYETVLRMQIFMMKDFLNDEDSKENLMKMNAIYKHDKNGKYRRSKVFDKKNIKNYNRKSMKDQKKILSQILRFYDASRMYTPTVQKNKYPIIEMRNKMPVFHPKFFKGITHTRPSI